MRLITNHPDAMKLGFLVLCLAILLSSVARVGWSASHWDATYDEYWHLYWSERALLENNFDREYTNFVSTTPVTMLNAGSREFARRAGNTDGQELKAAARLPTVAAYALLLGVVFGIGTTLVSARAGLLASTLTALDPNLQTHGALATVDIYFAIVTLCFLYQCIRFYQNPSFREAMLLALVLGFAFVVKLSAVLFLPVLLLVMVIAIARSGAEKFIPTFALYSLAGVAVASLAINLGYKYHDVGVFLKDMTLYSSFMMTLQDELPYLYLLLPVSFLEGFDQTLSFERVMQWNTVIFDQYSSDGVWYYFPVTWFFKTPIAVMLLAMVGLGLGARRILTGGPETAAPRSMLSKVLWIFLLQGLLFLVYFNFVFRTHVGLRYILMCLPMLYLLVSFALFTQRRRLWMTALMPLCLVVALLEQIPFWGNALSFSNAFISDKKNAWYILTDSNIDWGQNYTSVLAQAATEYPDASVNPPHIVQGQNIIRLNYLTGVFRNFEQHRWAREHLQPAAHLQHTHLLYEVTDAQFEQFLSEQNTALQIADPADCNGTIVTQLPFQFVAESTGDQPLCLDAGRGRVTLRVSQGWGVAGTFANGLLNGCQGYPMEMGKQAKFKLEGGIGQLCVTSNEVGTVWEVSRLE